MVRKKEDSKEYNIRISTDNYESLSQKRIDLKIIADEAHIESWQDTGPICVRLKGVFIQWLLDEIQKEAE